MGTEPVVGDPCVLPEVLGSENVLRSDAPLEARGEDDTVSGAEEGQAVGEGSSLRQSVSPSSSKGGKTFYEWLAPQKLVEVGDGAGDGDGDSDVVHDHGRPVRRPCARNRSPLRAQGRVSLGRTQPPIPKDHP